MDSMRGSHEIRNHHIEKQHEQGPGKVNSTFLPLDEMEALFKGSSDSLVEKPIM